MQNFKASPGLVNRFKGSHGKIRLIDALLRQPLISGDTQLAKKNSKLVQLVDIKEGKELTTQGNSDNDLYFILNGNVSIRVNGHEITTRGTGEHIGELAMVDSTARRSASMVASENCTFAKLTEVQFVNLAKKNPELWRKIAVTLASRLRERNKFHPIQNNQPIVFIGSSLEGLQIAECIFKYLLHIQVIPRLWTEGVFEASKTTIEDLIDLTSQSDFAVIILTPDDITKSRGTRKASPRDNAILELGLFMGKLNRSRTYMIAPKNVDIKIPTDLLGVTKLQYQYRGRRR